MARDSGRFVGGDAVAFSRCVCFALKGFALKARQNKVPGKERSDVAPGWMPPMIKSAG